MARHPITGCRTTCWEMAYNHTNTLFPYIICSFAKLFVILHRYIMISVFGALFLADLNLANSKTVKSEATARRPWQVCIYLLARTFIYGARRLVILASVGLCVLLVSTVEGNARAWVCGASDVEE